MVDFDFSTLVTDRKKADVDAVSTLLKKPMGLWTADELDAFNGAILKGSYDYTDLNRVTACMDYLDERLTGLGYLTGYQRIQVPHGGGDEGGEAPAGRLPEGYRELAWIESTGTQRIDTFFKPNQNTRVLMDFEPTAPYSSIAGIFGARDTASGTAPLQFVFWNSAESAFRTDYFGTQQTLNVPTLLVRHTVDKNKNITTIDGTSTTNILASGQCTKSMYLFCVNSAGEAMYFSKYKLYACQIYDNGTLVRDYIPCISPGGAVGIYDLVTAEFYGNAGTGSFIAGPEVYGNDEHTLLLLHGEDLTDSSLRNVQLTNSGVDISATQSKFGGKSFYFNGSAFLEILEKEFFTGEKDFSIDWWEYRDQITGTNSVFNQAASSGAGVGLLLGYWQSGGPLVMLGSGSGGGWDVNGGVSMGAGITQQWVHRAFVRDGDTFFVFENGVQKATFTSSASLAYTANPFIGKFDYSGDTSCFHGYIDEFRISDIARWSSDFTPPEKAYEAPPEPEEPTPTKGPFQWYEDDIPSVSLMVAYLDNVSALRAVLPLPEDIPAAPGAMEKLKQQEANSIETILLAVENTIQRMRANLFYCGEVYCGEV